MEFVSLLGLYPNARINFVMIKLQNHQKKQAMKERRPAKQAAGGRRGTTMRGGRKV
jgi:hypothetical protein